MKKITLFIDTTDNTKVEVSLSIDNKKYTKVAEVGRASAQVVLPFIEELLSEQQLTLKELTHIDVKQGPGSFTGLRVGVSIANVLSSALQIPVNGNSVGEIIEPLY